MTLVSSSRAVANALYYARKRTRFRAGWCDHVVALENGLAYSGYVTAAAHFHAVPTKYRHGTGTAPAGALCFWTGGSHGAGHVALSVGRGYCASTDIVATGYVNIVPISLIHSRWGQTYVGWTDAYYGPQGTRVIAPPVAARPPVATKVSLSGVIHAANLDPKAPQGHRTAYASVMPTEKALVAEHLLEQKWVDGSFGTKTVEAYAAWQRHLGYSGADADGIPGKTSLTELGKRHGFTVVA